MAMVSGIRMDVWITAGSGSGLWAAEVGER